LKRSGTETTEALSSTISLPSDPLLFRRAPFPFATGGVRYVDTPETYPMSEARIVIPVTLKSVARPVLAVVDTGAPWCIFEPLVAQTLTRSFMPLQGQVSLSTRWGVVRGALYRGTVTISADEGDSLDVESTVFLSPDWRGPNFIGYQGLLQRIRFAVDPETNLFYFGRD
jgi:hypothetical protein